MAGFLDESKECERVTENLQPSSLSSTIYNFAMLSVSRLISFLFRYTSVCQSSLMPITSPL